ncbi:MAG TPA: glycosyl hydrolase family 65 protein [Actinomycetaceae bacterium]|nr:glycosyl hydrolase family 65 protein [Actinomycetaceae bacterium]
MKWLADEDPLDRHRFPVDEWRFVETQHCTEDLGTTETLFSVGNGYLGMRANPEEGRDAVHHGTFINGFHETWPIHHAEEAFGFAKTGQTIVNVPDAKVIKLYVDDEPLLLSIADLDEYERSIDFREGILRRHLLWRTPSGKLVQIDSTRMVSFTDRHLALMTFEVTMLEGDAPVVISSQVLNRADGRDEYYKVTDQATVEFDPRKAAEFGRRVLEPQGHWNSQRRMILGYRCANSAMTIGVGTDHSIETRNRFEELIDAQEDIGKKVYRVDAKQGVRIKVTKAAAYHSSRYVPVRELFDRCRRTLDRVRENGFEHFYEGQREWLQDYWRGSDVMIQGHDSIQQAVRWCLFQIAQAAARADQLGVAAKGVTGSGYEGHYFWDTDVYVVPFLVYCNPWLARNALRFRYNILDKARERAAELTLRGALFPWRTISGDEASAYYAAGTAQYHINADVAYAFSKYEAATGDTAFIHRDGAEVLAETARMWADLGFWRVNNEKSFHIHSVTGPDEYTTVVNNNLFTNVMARSNLSAAAALMRRMRSEHPDAYERLALRIELRDEEVAEWEACAEGMFIPYDETLRVHPQDEHFLERELWDVPATPAAKRPLLLHYHPLVIYRFQVLKQADVVLALFLQGDQFTLEEKRNNFDYYDPITTGDSTLSAVVQSIIAAEVGYDDLAVRYFLRGLFVDLADLHRNASDGVHIASAGGVWNSLVYGFGGFRDHGGKFTFDPRLPVDWPELRFRLRIAGDLVEVRVLQRLLELTLVEGEGPIAFTVRGKDVEVTAEKPVRVVLYHQGPRRFEEPDFGAVGEYRADGTLITAGVPSLDEPSDETGLIGLDPLEPIG